MQKIFSHTKSDYYGSGSKDTSWIRTFMILVMVIGFALRAFQYFYNRSLWVDEAMLALNIIDRGFSGLLAQLDYSQGAPIGFLFLEKLSTLVLGPNELALRLFPFIFSISSMIVFWLLANKLVEKKIAALAMVFFALNQYLIYYSSEVKQYSGDVFFVALLYLLFVSRIESEITIRETIIAATIGAIVIWFSHPTVFVLAGFGISKALYDGIRRKWKNIFKLASIGSVWLASGLLFYVISLKDLAKEESLIGYWGKYFAPLDIFKLSTLKWYVKRSLEIMGNPIGLSYGEYISLFILLVGLAAMLVKNRIKTIFILSPFVFLLIASSLKLYPFGGRLVLFTVPILLIFLTYGAFFFIEKNSILTKWAGIIITAFLVAATTYPTVELTLNRGKEEIKPALAFINADIEENDAVLLPSTSYPSFIFYKKTHDEYKNLKNITCRSPKKAEEESLNCLQQLYEYKNVWLLLSHYNKFERGFFIEHLSDMGIKIDQFIGTGVEAHKFKIRSR